MVDLKEWLVESEQGPRVEQGQELSWPGSLRLPAAVQEPLRRLT